MISAQEQLQERIAGTKHIVVHGCCPDGLAAAVLAHDALPGARVSFLQHKTTEYENLVVEPDMMFIDIVPPPARIQEFAAQGAVVLDHHEKARTITEACAYGVYSPNLSGAEMAFKYVWNPLRPTRTAQMPNARYFAELAGIRDTWRRQDEKWTLACEQAAALAFFPCASWMDIKNPFSPSNDALWAERRAIGAMLFQQKLDSTKRSVDRAWRVTTNGGNRVVVLGGQNVSDAAELIGSEADIVASFSYKVEGSQCMFVAGLRSHTGVDVGDLAVHHGGGGHRNSAGFSVPFETDPYAPGSLAAVANPFTLFQMLVEQWECS